LSILFGSGSDSDTSEIFRIGSDHQILISAQHCTAVKCWTWSGVKRNCWPLRNFWPVIVFQLFCFSE